VRLPCLILCCLFIAGCDNSPAPYTLPHGPTPWLAVHPDTESMYAADVQLGGVPGLTWTGDLKAALRWAEEENKLVLVEWTAVTNTKCAVVHRQLFPKAPIRQALRPYILVMLYADVVPNEFYKQPPPKDEGRRDGEANYRLERDTTYTAALPLYAILKPIRQGKGQMLATFEGVLEFDNSANAYVYHEREFLAFLQRRQLNPR